MKRSVLVVPFALAVLPQLSCGEAPSAPVSVTETATPSAAALSVSGWRDRMYFKQITAANVDEIELGKLAVERSSNELVRGFAEKMITAHSALRKDAAALSGRTGLVVAESMDAMGKVQAALLRNQSDAGFDKAYLAGQVEIHNLSLALLKQTVKHADDLELKAFAAKTIPQIAEHLGEAKAILHSLP
jgi:putative membrane protein